MMKLEVTTADFQQQTIMAPWDGGVVVTGFVSKGFIMLR